MGWRAEKEAGSGPAARFSKEKPPEWSCPEAALPQREAEQSTGKGAGVYVLRQNSTHQVTLWGLEKSCP